MRFSVALDTQPLRFLRKLPRESALRILETLERSFASEPVPHDAKRVQGEHGVFRIRVGDVRALYRVRYDTRTVVVFKIERRDKAY